MEKFNERVTKMLMECEVEEEQINSMDKKVVLDTILSYEGFIGYTDWIIGLVEEVYGVSLEE